MTVGPLDGDPGVVAVGAQVERGRGTVALPVGREAHDLALLTPVPAEVGGERPVEEAERVLDLVLVEHVDAVGRPARQGRGDPVALPVDDQDGRLVEPAVPQRGGRVRDGVRHHLDRWSTSAGEERVREEVLVQRGRPRRRVLGLPREGDGVDLGHRDAGRRQAVRRSVHGRLAERVLAPGEALLLDGGENLGVADQCCRGVVSVAPAQPEHEHGGYRRMTGRARCRSTTGVNDLVASRVTLSR